MSKLLTLGLTTAWSTAQAFGFGARGARTVALFNGGSVPVELRYTDGGPVIRLEAHGEAGSSRVLHYERSAAPTQIQGRGVGGSAIVTVEAFEDVRPYGIPRVMADLLRVDGVHPLPFDGDG